MGKDTFIKTKQEKTNETLQIEKGNTSHTCSNSCTHVFFYFLDVYAMSILNISCMCVYLIVEG